MSSVDLFERLTPELDRLGDVANAPSSERVRSYPSAAADRLAGTLFANLRNGGFCTHLVTGHRPWNCRDDRFETARQAARRGCRIERAFLVPDRLLRHDATLLEHLRLDRAAGIRTLILYVGDIMGELATLAPGSLEFGLWDDELCDTTARGIGIAENGAHDSRISARAEDVRRTRRIMEMLNEKADPVESEETSDPGAEVEEPLILSAPIARAFARDHCRHDPVSGESCAWYHGSWQYFRLLEVITTLRTNGAYLIDVFRSLARNGGFRRILISGTADYAMLAHLLYAYRRESAAIDITVVDWCETPLFLNRWYATQFGATVETYLGDILAYETDMEFDLVCTHSFLGRFDSAGRRRLIANWHSLLRPGGKVVTVKRIRPDHRSDRVRFTPQQAARFIERARRGASHWRDFLDVTPDEVVRWAETYSVRHGNFAIRSREEIQELFESGGFAVERLDSGGAEEQRLDRPSAAASAGNSERIRVIATRRD